MAAETIAVRRPVPAARFPGLAPVGLMVRRLWRGALLWGGVFALTVWALVSQFAREYPTAADRARLVATMGSDVGSQAIFGPAHHLARAPAAPVRWQSAAILVAIGLVAAAIGAIAFARRDLKGA